MAAHGRSCELTSPGYGQPLTVTIPTRRLINIKRPSRLEPRTFLNGTCSLTTRSPTFYRLSYAIEYSTFTFNCSTTASLSKSMTSCYSALFDQHSLVSSHYDLGQLSPFFTHFPEFPSISRNAHLFLSQTSQLLPAPRTAALLDIKESD